VEKSQLDKLLKLASPEEQYQLKVFYNASIKILKEYQTGSTAAKLKDLQAAEAALDDFADRLQERYTPEQRTFSNRLQVTKYLQEEGWQVSKSTVYNRIGKAKLLPREDGLFHLKDVKKYAKTFLKRRETGQTLRTEQDELQRRKAKLEVDKLEEDLARMQRKREIEEGLYIPTEQLELEMAARAGVLDAGLAHFFQSEAGGWINLVGGDQRKLPELIGALIDAKDRFMNQYARAKEFVVEIGETADS